MTLKDEDLRRLYRSYVGIRADANRKRCPSIKDLYDFFETRTRTSKKLKIVDHVTNCAACAEEFEFLRELQQYQDQITQGAREIRAEESPFAPSTSARNGIVSFGQYASVTVGVLFVVASLVIIVQKWSRSADVRAAPSSVLLVQPNQKNPGSRPLVFKWREFKGAEVYILELFDEALLPTWKSPETSTPYLTLPEDVRERLPANRPYFWMVTAYRGGDKLAESELLRFMLIEKHP